MKKQTGKGLSFVKRMYLPRGLGLGLGFLSVAAALDPLQPATWVWALLLFHAFGGAHVQFQLARLSSYPYWAERRNLMFDSIMGGFWAGAVGLNPLPAFAVLGMMSMNNISSGGPRFFWRGCLAQLVGVLIAVAIFSPTLVTTSTPLQLYASLPLLLIYPLSVGLACYELAIKLSEHKNRLGILSRTDSLTGLFNHGAWKDLLQIEYGTCQALNRSTTIALIDIDHFKAINDTHGHIVGDNVLKQLGSELIKNLRDTDLAGRYGGDEFCVILPNTSLSQAAEILERLRQTVNHQRDPAIPSLTMSLSIGIAAYKPHFNGAGMWLNEADKALYAAKSTGRNKINFAPVESTVFACTLGAEIG
ncbi:diguanylate cyclase [Pseudomonas sp. CCI3.2]|uniref:diguanylate cyclase n=1 Tax=unclassified Pseudomonas TaxID=196821 RepID=UPI002AC949E6|nr:MULTISPECIES: diguanylate cyclase [unclassified Pseudomonas]MEB0075820.1 diguanylate cyclase [Pseudomonas sp. MH10out]MEB0102782.1 diguanylate cyclase [Pseudomonas sp. CCI3.2]MEB0123819.1 diguanylate cyclase [Pseudomonas sp. CCI1.2]MEB0131574.1 diguanylate cyclase [Pseudomonas sp. CCI2.4]MEB0156467.1 diguanylate cyclase [Pseudomonas sp. AH2 (2023)]